MDGALEGSPLTHMSTSAILSHSGRGLDVEGLYLNR